MKKRYSESSICVVEKNKLVQCWEQALKFLMSLARMRVVMHSIHLFSLIIAEVFNGLGTYSLRRCMRWTVERSTGYANPDKDRVVRSFRIGGQDGLDGPYGQTCAFRPSGSSWCSFRALCTFL